MRYQYLRSLLPHGDQAIAGQVQKDMFSSLCSTYMETRLNKSLRSIKVFAFKPVLGIMKLLWIGSKCLKSNTFLTVRLVMMLKVIAKNIALKKITSISILVKCDSVPDNSHHAICSKICSFWSCAFLALYSSEHKCARESTFFILPRNSNF